MAGQRVAIGPVGAGAKTCRYQTVKSQISSGSMPLRVSLHCLHVVRVGLGSLLTDGCTGLPVSTELRPCPHRLRRAAEQPPGTHAIPAQPVGASVS